MKKTRKVSIIIPVYNAEKYIEECIKSCLAQTYENCEIIIVNDGSTDGSENKIKPYFKKVKYIRQENMGGSVARNTGLDNASGEYIYFLDSDDVIFPQTIRNLVDAIEFASSDLSIGAFMTIDIMSGKKKTISFCNEDRLFEGGDLSVLFSAYPNPSTKLFRASIIKKYGLYFEKLRLGQDLNFYFRYLMHCQKAFFVNQIIYEYRISPGTISTSYDDRILGIVDAFEGVESYAKKISFPLKDIQNVKWVHFCFQISKTKLVYDAEMRKKIFYKLVKKIRSVPVSRDAVTYNYARNSILKTRIIILFGWVYISNFVYWLCNRMKK